MQPDCTQVHDARRANARESLTVGQKPLRPKDPISLSPTFNRRFPR
jgi:hypothetical protein